jgi:hypothetical protein
MYNLTDFLFCSTTEYYVVLLVGLKKCRLISLSHGAFLKGHVKIRQWVSNGKICHLPVAVLCHALSRPESVGFDMILPTVQKDIEINQEKIA